MLVLIAPIRAIGASLVVHPVANLPLIAKKPAKFAIINGGKTQLDRIADVVVNQGIGETPSNFLVV